MWCFSHSVVVLQLCLQGGGTWDADVYPDNVVRTTSDKVLPTYEGNKYDYDSRT